MVRNNVSLAVLLNCLQHTDAIYMMAASPKRGGGGPGAKKAGGGGFGAKPKPAAPAPMLESVVAKWPTRLPADSDPCMCGSGDSYGDCCRRYHAAEVAPETPTRVLQSRYSAFAYRLPLHLIRTTHRSNRDWREDKAAWARELNQEGMFDSFVFVGLAPGPEEGGSGADEAFIEFRVDLRNEQTGAEISFRERSRFVREGGGWLYASGDVATDADMGLDVLNRN